MHQTTSDKQQLKENLKELKVLKDALRKYVIHLLYAPLGTLVKTA